MFPRVQNPLILTETMRLAEAYLAAIWGFFGHTVITSLVIHGLLSSSNNFCHPRMFVDSRYLVFANNLGHISKK